MNASSLTATLLPYFEEECSKVTDKWDEGQWFPCSERASSCMAHARIHTCMPTHACMYACMHAHTNTHADTHKRACVCIHTHIYKSICTRTPTQIHLHTRTHVHIDTTHNDQLFPVFYHLKSAYTGNEISNWSDIPAVVWPVLKKQGGVEMPHRDKECVF